MTKIFVPATLTALWKNLRRGRNGKTRTLKFRQAAMKHLAIKSESYFYQIMNGKVEIDVNDLKVLSVLAQSYKQIR